VIRVILWSSEKMAGMIAHRGRKITIVRRLAFQMVVGAVLAGGPVQHIRREFVQPTSASVRCASQSIGRRVGSN
jgi:hypothetical protein